VTGSPTPPRLGRLLVERGVITEQELEQALARSAEMGRPLGAAILELDLVPPSEITDLLAVQRAWRPLGWMLVERGLITEQELSDCLDDAQRAERRLGEVVRARGLVPARVLESLLAEQYQLEVELERGFGNGLRGEIERRYRLKRAPHGDEDENIAQALQFERATATSAPQLRAPSSPAPRAERAGDPADEIRRLREALAERDATIRLLRQRLGDTDAVAV